MTIDTTTGPGHRAGALGLTWTYTRYSFLETVRIPIAVLGTTFFPAASMIFFVVPFTGDDPVGATLATGSMVTFAVMLTCLFQYGVGVAEDRARAWDPFTRTLPVGAGPRFAGRLLNGFGFIVLALVPVLLAAWLLTEATASPPQLLLAVGAVLVGAVPFTLMGLAIGYALPTKAALAVAQIVFFPLAFGGGLLSAPGQAPGFIEDIAPFLPTRGAVELMWAAVGDVTPQATSMVALALWTLTMGAVAVWAYRRDEGRRFR